MIRVLHGDAREQLRKLPSGSFDCIVTSPPYFQQRDYGVTGQIGLEPTLAQYLDAVVGVCRDLATVLKPSGTLWLNVGDAYANDGKWGGRTSGKHARALHASTGMGRGKVATGMKPKDLMMIPNRLAMLLQDDGWYVRSEIIWNKSNAMPESVTDRPTRAHEKLWLLARSGRTTCWRHEDGRWVWAQPAPDYIWKHRESGERSSTERPGPEWRRVDLWAGFDYYYEAPAIAEPPDQNARSPRVGTRSTRKRGVPPRHAQYPTSADQSGLDAVARGNGRNARNVWTIPTRPYREAHFATFPPELAARCIKAGCPVGGHVLDPFGGAGTVGVVADRLDRHATLIELNPAYVELIKNRLAADAGMLQRVAAE